MQVIDYAAWKADLVAQIEASADTTEKGNRFVQRILRDYYQLSEDDSVNATDCAGAGDRGVDAIYTEPAEDEDPPDALLVQGKYGAAGMNFSPYHEFKKFAQALQQAIEGNPPTDALAQAASVYQHHGALRYVVATIEPLSDALQSEIEDIRKLANNRFQDQVVVESISLPDVYHEIANRPEPSAQVEMQCDGVAPLEHIFIGSATLVDVYQMLRHYARAHHGVLDSIYDRNVRKWLGKRAQSVNAGIARTLKEDPASFAAYNNGITIVCRRFNRTEHGLEIDSPQIVNGCQTTRTIYDYMENQFAGVMDQLARHPDAERYRRALLPFKLIAVEDLDGELVKNITRFSNKQNAVRGRDFLTLEDEFRRLKQTLAKRGYYLEVQTGEYAVLPKAQRDKFASGHLINAFDALRFYAAAVYAHPNTAFGHSSDFTPGGREFDTMIKGLTADDLYVPWLIAEDAKQLGYSVGAKRQGVIDDHRNQTRYFFLYVFFRIVSQALRNTPQIDLTTRGEMYGQLLRLREHSATSGDAADVFPRLLGLADETVATYMALAQVNSWYSDRNAFLKREDLLNEEHLILASGKVQIEMNGLRAKAKSILGA